MQYLVYQLTQNGFILNQLSYINKLESDFSSLPVYFIAFIQRPFAVNFLSAKFGSNILDNEFDNNVLNTLVPDLVRNFDKLKLLGRKI